MNKSTRTLGANFAGLFFVMAAGILASSNSGALETKATFTKDVAPIFYKRCVECHRPGEVAPMSLLTYQDARPWARSIRDKVLERAMPPWLAAPEVSHRFENERRLTQKEIDTIVAWANSGAPKGEDKDLPATPKFVEGWTIGQPDVVIAMPEEYSVPTDGVLPYKYFTVPTNFTEDKWVQASEIRPGNRSVVHHIIVSVRDLNSKGDARAEPGAERADAREGRGYKLSGFAPGEQPKIFPKETAKLIKAGSSLVFQVHYTTNGVPGKDRSYVGIIFAKDPVHKNVLTGTATNTNIGIPPGDPNHEVRSSWVAKEDVHLVDLMPHMHVRGKDFTYTAVYPDGRSEIILQVPRYDFNWQLLYRLREPFAIPKGSRLECVAHFDNSTNNKYNPDPTKEVRWGDQTWEEMMIGWFDYTRDAEDLRPARSTASVQK